MKQKAGAEWSLLPFLRVGKRESKKNGRAKWSWAGALRNGRKWATLAVRFSPAYEQNKLIKQPVPVSAAKRIRER